MLAKKGTPFYKPKEILYILNLSNQTIVVRIMSNKFEIKPNTGYLFHNNNKQTEKHPDIRGELNIDGKIYNVAGWKKIAKSKSEFWSLSIKEKVEYNEEDKREYRKKLEAAYIDSKLQENQNRDNANNQLLNAFGEGYSDDVSTNQGEENNSNMDDKPVDVLEQEIMNLWNS